MGPQLQEVRLELLQMHCAANLHLMLTFDRRPSVPTPLCRDNAGAAAATLAAGTDMSCVGQQHQPAGCSFKTRVCSAQPHQQVSDDLFPSVQTIHISAPHMLPV